MSEHKRGRPSGGRIRKILGFLRLPQAIPGWVFLLAAWLWELVDVVHRVTFLREIFEGHRVNPVAFLQHWGWLVGCAWLAGVVFWAATRPDEGVRARQLGDLKDAVLDCARRFEALSLAYEQKNLEATSEESEKIRKAREAYLWSIHRVIREAIASIPADRQGEYRDVLKDVLINHAVSFDSFPVTRFSKALGPMSPIEEYLYPPESHA